MRFAKRDNYILEISSIRKIIENVLSLSILQIFNYVLPLVTFPYLLRVLGPGNFGLVMFSQALIQYFALITDYGFNLSATREVSIYREDRRKLSAIFSSVFITKILLLVVSFFILVILLVSFEEFRDFWYIHLFTFCSLIGNVFFPVWLFQGLESMKYISILNGISKIVVTIFIFLLIRESDDYYLVPLLNSLGNVLMGMIAWWIALRKFHLSFTFPNKDAIKSHLIDGWYVFISTFSTSLYTVSNTFLLGLFASNTIVGYYSAVEKIVKSLYNLYMPVSQTLFPYISHLAKREKRKVLEFIKFSFFILGLGSFLVSVGICLFSKQIVKWLLGTEHLLPVDLLTIFSFLPFVLVLSNLLGTQTLLAFNFKKIFTMSIVIPSLLHIALSIIFTPFYLAYGLAFVTMFTEILIVIFRMVGINRVKHDLFRGN